MLKFSEDWRFFAVISIVSWGFWGLLSKAAISKVEWSALLFISGISYVIVALVFEPGLIKNLGGVNLTIPVLAGITAATGITFFYRALEKGPATSVIPITSMYILVTTILAVILLNEPLTLKKAAGLVSAVIAIILLS